MFQEEMLPDTIIVLNCFWEALCVVNIPAIPRETPKL